MHRLFYGLDQREDELVQRNQAQAQGCGAGEGESLAHLVERQKRVGPAVSGAEDVPGAEDGGIEMLLLDPLFALGANGDVVLHDGKGSGLGDAEIDEMRHSEFGAGGDGFPGRDQVNGAKLGGFRRGTVKDANHVDEGIGGANELAVGVGVERIAGDDFTFSRQFGFRARADQDTDPMATLEKNGNEAAADVAGSSGNEDAPGCGRLG